MADVKDFLNSKSMLTPGIAGAITMLITNVLHQQFALPHKWVGLTLSFILGSLVFSDVTAAVWQRIIFYLLNSLIIFAMAVGANTAGAATLPTLQTDNQFTNGTEAHPEDGGDLFFQDWLSGS